MKKFISLFLAVLSLISILSINTFAQDKISEPALVIGDEIIAKNYIYHGTVYGKNGTGGTAA